MPGYRKIVLSFKRWKFKPSENGFIQYVNFNVLYCCRGIYAWSLHTEIQQRYGLLAKNTNPFV